MFRENTHEMLQNHQKSPQYLTLNYEVNCILKGHFTYLLIRSVPTYVWRHTNTSTTVLLFRRTCKFERSYYSLRPVCPSVCTKQLSSHRNDFHEIWYLSNFLNSVHIIRVSLTSGKNNGFFTWNKHTILIISRSVLRRMRSVSGKIYREN
jgi:hypothetical protein